MAIWIAILGMFAAAAIGIAREPRRLRNGILILAALSLTALTVIAITMDKLSSPTGEAAAWFLLGLLAIALLTTIALAIFLLYTGVVMLRKEARSLPNLLSLLLGLGLLGYAALGLLALALNSSQLAGWILFSIPPIGYLGFVFSSFLLYSWLYGIWARRNGGPVTAVIVLGAGLAGDRVTPLLASRLGMGKSVFERSRAGGTDPVMIVSGGKGADETVSEADAMSAWLRVSGVPAPSILKEDRSTTTEENLRFSREICTRHGITGRSAVVTNDYHALRAATLMARLHIPGYAIGSATARYYWPSATIREFLALLRDHLRLNAIVLAFLSVPAILLAVVRIASLLLSI